MALYSGRESGLVFLCRPRVPLAWAESATPRPEGKGARVKTFSPIRWVARRQVANAQYGFTLERLSGVNPPDVAALHWPLGQEVDHWSGPTVPLVLGGATVATCFE